MRVISPPGNIGISKSMTWSVGVPFSIKQYRYIQYDTSYVIKVDTKNDYGILIDCHYLCKTLYHGNLWIPELQFPLASSSPSFSEGLIPLFIHLACLGVRRWKDTTLSSVGRGVLCGHQGVGNA